MAAGIPSSATSRILGDHKPLAAMVSRATSSIR
jgi:hypothetical protein